ncbi:MAG TPA: maleylpyruvate isomerase family mycothiol-dependent enzyme [Ilumatobacteraceae bacterium]|nr:maleylpyruvate isomerase family mycothiol-dependent enzyme [Ilumatobacteraceae bacterium]
MIPTDTIDKLEAVWRSTSALGAQLDERDWKLPTDLPGWTVQDNLAHLIGTERALQGLPAAEAPSEVGSHVKNPIGQFNEAEIEARRGRTGGEVLQEWDALVDLRLATLRNADDAHFAKEMMTPTGPGTMADFLHIRVLDCWVHEQDMRRAVGRAGHLGGPAAEHTIDRLLRTLPVVVGKRAATPEGGAVIVDISGEVSRHVVCEVNGGRAAIVPEPANEPLATVRVDSETFVVLATGRRTAASIAERIELGGDASLGQCIVDNLNMMI